MNQIDRFIWILPKRYLDRPLWDDVLGLARQAGPTGHRLVAAMRYAIMAVACQGNNVIADHVLVEDRRLRDCALFFSDLPAWFIGVRCPLEIVKQRERARHNRTLG